MKRRVFGVSFGSMLAVQLLVCAAVAASYSRLSDANRNRLRQTVTHTAAYSMMEVVREQPLQITPLYDDPQVVSDEELAAVLKQVQPKFPRQRLKPNHVEHALRTWGVDATFDDPQVLSGIELRDFLIDHGKYLASWSGKAEPLLADDEQGIAVRWGQGLDASVHHDHWLASLTEAGIGLHETVFTPGRHNMTIRHVLQQALFDFRLDEREIEWSVMAFGFWLPPAKEWYDGTGRRLSFDLLAERLLRGHKQIGVCGGTHRIYSLVVLLRLDDEFHILSRTVRDAIWSHLLDVRDLLVASQYEDGRWPYNWPDGADAPRKPHGGPAFRDVIATGHHLEWLAIAPPELHPPRESICTAADWAIQQTTRLSHTELLSQYTFHSHVGNALALWRKTRPSAFWRAWIQTHPAGNDE